MICPHCLGKSQPFKEGSAYCEHCGGFGVMHCCEGDRAVEERNGTSGQDACGERMTNPTRARKAL